MKNLLLTSVVTASLLTPFAASALIIDHFNVGIFHSTTPAAEPGGSQFSGYIAGDAVGGFRSVIANQVAGVTPGGVSADMNPDSFLRLSSKDGVDAAWQIQYVGSGGGMPPANFSGGGALGVYILFGSADVGGGSLSMSATDGVNFRSTAATPQAIPTGSTMMFFPFTTFSVGSASPVDFSSVTGFIVDIAGVNSYDASVNLIETIERPPGLPDAGGTMMLLSIGVGFLGLARWKMNA